jgi:16S rRNA (cytosine1402-N4)-methyltransferase
VEKQLNYHESVLLDESIQGLAISADGIYLDLTYGGGGHSRLILEKLGPQGRLLAFDQDEASRVNIIDDQRLTFIPSNFRHLRRFVGFHGYKEVDGVLADLGVSSHQFDQPERGFSYRFPDVRLDMRMDQMQGLTAAMILNQWEAVDLQNMFSQYGEIRNSRTLAQAIITRRHARPFITVGDLLEVMDVLARGDRHRYLAQVFQALRIAVNDEMGALDEMLQGALACLKPGGRLVVLTYHSLEDRMVKRFMRDGNSSGEPEKDWFGKINRPFNVITRTPATPDEQEIKRNSRAHSAKLRIAEKR